MEMQYRTDSRGGNALSALGLGCMRLPSKLGSIDADATAKILLRALELGVNYFDTAYLYPGSEETLGVIMQRHGVRDQLFLATKLPHGKCRSLIDIGRYFDTSLERLRTTWIDYYLIHNLVSFAQWNRLLEMGIVEWIAQRKQAGVIGQIGFSFHGPITEFEKILDSYDWDFVQIQYNYVNEHYQAGRTGLDMAYARGLPVMIMEPLLGGKLATGLSPRMLKAFSIGDPNRSPAEWGLRWLWDQPQVTCVLSGMNSLEQLENNAHAAAKAYPGCLSVEERAVIEVARDEFRAAFKVPCTGCNYCMPCPKGISIPACFAAYNESFSLGLPTALMHYFTSVGAGGEELHLASDCIRCGSCAKKCPQHIAIPDELVKVRKRLQPGPVGKGLQIAGKIMSR